MARAKSPQIRKGISRLQALCAALGLMITLGAVVVLVRSVLLDQSPPDLTVQAEAFRRIESGWAVDVKVMNRGDQTAAAVEIEGEAAGGRVGATLDYVPGHGEKAAVLVFASDERPQPLLRIRGWSSP